MLKLTEPEVKRLSLEATAISLGPSNLEGLGDNISNESSPEAAALSARSCNQACNSKTEYTVVPVVCLISPVDEIEKSDSIAIIVLLIVIHLIVDVLRHVVIDVEI